MLGFLDGEFENENECCAQKQFVFRGKEDINSLIISQASGARSCRDRITQTELPLAERGLGGDESSITCRKHASSMQIYSCQYPNLCV